MMTGEECLYVFDASLFLVALRLALVHPGSLINSVGVKQAERLTGDAESYIPLNRRES